jgi:multidrug efflux pump subunit AcrB
LNQSFDIESFSFSAGFAFVGVVIAFFILKWTAGLIRIAIIWIFLIAALFFDARFGLSIAINPATHQPDFRPLITVSIVS